MSKSPLAGNEEFDWDSIQLSCCDLPRPTAHHTPG